MRGYAIVRSGWATVTVGGVAKPLPGRHSAWRAARLCETSDVKWQLSSGGRIVFRSQTATNFTLNFGSLANAARFGFSLSSYSGAAQYSALALAPGTFAPFARDVAAYRERFIDVQARSVPLARSHVRAAVPGLEWLRPSYAIDAVAVDLLRALDDWETYLETPARVDLALDGNSPALVEHDAEGISVRWVERQDFGKLTLQLSEVTP
jgi:hypothetical protein